MLASQRLWKGAYNVGARGKVPRTSNFKYTLKGALTYNCRESATEAYRTARHAVKVSIRTDNTC